MFALGNRPLIELKENYMAQGLAGEAVLLVMQDLFLLSTDPQVIPEHRQRVGVVIMIVMVVNIVFAVGIMTFESIKETIR